jgi:hypothetical protein
MLVVSTGDGAVLVVEADDTLATRRVIDTDFTPASTEIIDRCVTVARDGTLLAMKDTEFSFSTWDIATGVRQRRLRGHDWQHPCRCTFHGGASDMVTRTAETMSACAVDGHRGSITALALNHAGNVAASVDEQAEVFMWSLCTGEPLQRLRYCLQGLTLVMNFAPDDITLVVGDSNGEVAEYVDSMRLSPDQRAHSESARSLARAVVSMTQDKVPSQVFTVAWRADSRMYYAGFEDGTIATVPAPHAEQTLPASYESFQFLKAGASCVCSLALAPCGSLLAVAGSDGYDNPESNGAVAVYNVHTMAKLWALQVEYDGPPDAGHGGEAPQARRRNADLLSVVFSRDSALLFAASIDGKLRVWCVEQGKLLHTRDMHCAVLCVSVCTDRETHQRQERKLAIAMGAHHRVGAESHLIQELPSDLLQTLVQLVQ